MEVGALVVYDSVLAKDDALLKDPPRVTRMPNYDAIDAPDTGPCGATASSWRQVVESDRCLLSDMLVQSPETEKPHEDRRACTFATLL